MYLTGSIGAATRPLLDARQLGYMRTPGGGSTPEVGWMWAADNGCYGKGWPGPEKWLEWLQQHTPEQRAFCLFATLPDVVGDAEASLARSLTYLDAVQALGYPIALVTQDGMTPDMVPWDRIDWLFIGGTDAHKLGPEAKRLIAAAKRHGKRIHVGRVNSQRRYESFAALGCDSADGTYLAFGPHINLPKLQSWMRKHATHHPLFTIEEKP